MPRALAEAKADLYRTFESYRNPGREFCTFCYGDDEIEYYRETPAHEISTERARKLLWEAADHWESDAVYRHYLPRILTALAPPESCDAMFPEHLFEVLAHQNFERWPEREKVCVIGYMRELIEVAEFADAEEKKEWRLALASLRKEPLQLP